MSLISALFNQNLSTFWGFFCYPFAYFFFFFCLLLTLVDVQSFFFWHVIIQRYKFLKAFFAVLHQFWSSNNLATWCEQLTQWKRPWCWERLKAKGEEGSRGWDGWMASPNQWIWVWANSGRWWRTGKPGMLLSTGLQRVGHDWENEQPPPIFIFSVLIIINFDLF